MKTRMALALVGLTISCGALASGPKAPVPPAGEYRRVEINPACGADLTIEAIGNDFPGFEAILVTDTSGCDVDHNCKTSHRVDRLPFPGLGGAVSRSGGCFVLKKETPAHDPSGSGDFEATYRLCFDAEKGLILLTLPGLSFIGNPIRCEYRSI